MKQRIAFGAVLFAALAAACQDQQIAPAARFRGPTDAVPAGSSRQYIYMTGGVRDALYVMNANSGTVRAATFGSFVRAPNKFFPLEIPVGRSPQALNVTADGLFVIAACPSEQLAYVVEADTQRVVKNADGSPLTVGLGQGAAMILRAPNSLDGRDHFYVTNAADRSLSEVALDRAAATWTFEHVRTLDNVGSMVRIALSADGKTIFGADASGTAVHRISLATGSTMDIDVGGPSLDVAVIAGVGVNKEILLVARPDTLSVDVYDASTGKQIDTNPRFTPLLGDGEAFQGVYIGDVPARITPVRLADEVTTTIRCPGSDTPILLQQFAIVATDAGRVYYINLDAAIGEDMPQFALVDFTYCSARVVANDTATSPTLFTRTDTDPGLFPFVECPSEQPRRRAICIDPTGVTVFPGNTPETTYTLVYEGVVPGADRSTGGGTLSEDGTRLEDVNLDLTTVGIQPTDFLVIENEPAVNPEGCKDAYGDEARRKFRIVSGPVVNDNGRTQVVIEAESPPPAGAPLLTSCFPKTDGGVEYVIRARETFLVLSTITNQPTFFIGRLGFEQAFGDAGDTVRFTVRKKSEIDPTGAQLTTGTSLQFKVSAPYVPVIYGRVTATDGSGTLPVGRVPTSILFGTLGDQTTRHIITLVTFAGNDTVIAFDPTDSDWALQDVLVLR